IGVILAWGPRLIDSVRAAEIVAAAGDVPVMGVIAGGTSRELMDLAGGIGLKGLQFHRDADPVVAADLRAAGLEVWRVALIRDHAHVSRQIAAARIGADRVLVE